MTNKYFFMFLTCLSLTFCCFASEEWYDYWQDGIRLCDHDMYEDALELLDASIENLEYEDDQSHPYVYIDRARINLILTNYRESLRDIQYVIDSPYLTLEDLIIAKSTLIMIYLNTGKQEEALEGVQELKKISPYFPKIEASADTIIIRNMPKCKCYQTFVRTVLLESNICEKETDIVMTDSGVCIAKRKKCTCGKQAMIGDNNRKKIEDCHYWCGKMSFTAMAWCSKVFKRWDCQTTCLFAVEFIKDACNWCCSTGSFYEKCVQPFEDIVKQMGQPCDPYFD